MNDKPWYQMGVGEWWDYATATVGGWFGGTTDANNSAQQNDAGANKPGGGGVSSGAGVQMTKEAAPWYIYAGFGLVLVFIYALLKKPKK